MTFFKRKEQVTAIVATIIALFSLGASFYKTDPEVYLFPRIAAVVIAILAAVLLIKEFLNRSNVLSSDEPLINWKTIWPFLVLGLIYLISLEKIGFYVSSFVAYFAICVIYGKCEMTDIKRGLFKLSVSTVFMIVLFILFWNLLHVRTPTGLLI